MKLGPSNLLLWAGSAVGASVDLAVVVVAAVGVVIGTGGLVVVGAVVVVGVGVVDWVVGSVDAWVVVFSERKKKV